MPLLLFKEIGSHLFPHAQWVDLRGWGESTILPSFVQYLDVAVEHGVRTKLITNGTIGRHSLWRRLADVGCLVGFSMDAAGAELFARLRGGASLAVVERTLARACSYYIDAGLSPADYLYICVTVSRANLGTLTDICELARKHGLQSCKLEPLKAAPGDPELLEHVEEEALRAMQRLREYASSTGFAIEYSASLVPSGTDPSATRKVCIHPWDYCYINARGRIGFCDHLNGREEFAWAGWEAGRFDEFWNGPKMRAFREQHLRRLSGETIVLCEDCNWCYERRYADLEHLVEPGWGRFRRFAE